MICFFPAPGKVIAQFAEDKTVILTNIKSSVGIIIQGFLLAAVAAIPLGLLIGLNARLGNAASYLTKFFSSIPPIVYIPYGIALLPTFRSVSVFVIFLASFWPIFAGTMSGVLNVDKRTVDSAKVLNVKKACHADIGYSSGITSANFPRLQSGTQRVIYPPDVC